MGYRAGGSSTPQPPLPHTHTGSDITTPVSNASNAAAVAWTAVAGKPATFPFAPHGHAGSEITGSVPSADAVPWTGISGRPATFPASTHTHSGADIVDGTLPASKLSDGSIAFEKLRTDQTNFSNLWTSQQFVHSGVAFLPGIYSCRLSVPNGNVVSFMVTVAIRNSIHEFALNNLAGATMTPSSGGGANHFDFTNVFDSRTFRLSFNAFSALAFLSVFSGDPAVGQTSFASRRIV